jgi:hypothetical protein
MVSGGVSSTSGTPRPRRRRQTPLKSGSLRAKAPDAFKGTRGIFTTHLRESWGDLQRVGTAGGGLAQGVVHLVLREVVVADAASPKRTAAFPDDDAELLTLRTPGRS